MICEIDFPGLDGERWQERFAHPHRVLLAHNLDEVSEVINAAEQAAQDGHWVVGFVGYEAAPAFDSALQVRPSDGSNVPLAAFAIYNGEDEITFDANESFACGPWVMGVTRVDACRKVDAIRAAIADGKYYQLNYTARLEASFSNGAAGLYASLRRAQPNGYNAFIDAGDWQIATVSPELFFDWTPDRILTTKPMKGTAAPGGNAAAKLRDSSKERAENLMIVDLLRNDLARVAETGSVNVVSLFDIESLPTALQMTSTVKCRTRVDATLLNVFRALFPCGSVTGAPKVAAMQAIAALETAPRGAYCGAIGVIRPNGHATFNVGIRTVTVDSKKQRCSCGIGSGITIDSSAAGEFEEWLVKRRFLLRATASFDLIETLLLEKGVYWLLERHLARLRHSALHFGFALDESALRTMLDHLASSHAIDRWRIRVVLSRDGKVSAECFLLEPDLAQIDVVLAASAIDSSEEMLFHKTTARSIYASRASKQTEVFDTLLYNERDEITEFTRGNVVVELEGKRCTPPLQSGLLPGVLRAELLARGELIERLITRNDLARASRLWFINSVRGELPARLLGAAPLP